MKRIGWLIILLCLGIACAYAEEEELSRERFVFVFGPRVGFRSHTGLEFGLGPLVTMTRSGLEIVLPVVYAVGWTFSFQDVYIPVDVAIVPNSSDGHIRIHLMIGFNFEL